MTIDADVLGTVKDGGADFFGVADLSPAREAIAAQGGAAMAAFPRAVAIGRSLADAMVDRLGVPPDRQAAELYRYFCYDLVNDQLDKIALATTMKLQGWGYTAFPVPAAPRGVSSTGLAGTFSSKIAAHLSGLGWIGKSCLLVTPEKGPRVRWASVLTDAPLIETGKALEQRCGTCEVCVRACPADAVIGRAFSDRESREERFRASDCDGYLRTRKEEVGLRVCGMCVQCCPYGKKGESQ